MQITYLFGGILILIAIIMILKSTARSDWLKSLFLFIFLVILSFVNFIVMMFVSFLLIRHQTLYLGNLFILFAIFVTISGIILFWWLNLLKHIINYDDTVLTLMEYYIQWSLIYVTIYQTIFSNIKRVTNLAKFIKIGNLLDPNIFITLVLPSFISVWIAIIMYKKHTCKI